MRKLTTAGARRNLVVRLEALVIRLSIFQVLADAQQPVPDWLEQIARDGYYNSIASGDSVSVIHWSSKSACPISY